MVESKTRLYNILDKMKQRCYNPNHKNFKDYGAKGVTICEQWRTDYFSFKNWALQNGYKDVLTIERISYLNGYCPENCTWIPKEQQNQNTSKTIKLTVRGKFYTCLTLVAKEYGLNPDTVRDRYNRGDREERLIRPVNLKS